MWSIHDFLAYGLFAGCVTKGHMGCPPCSLTIESQSSRKLNKILYCGNQCYLPRNHLYWRAQTTFNGETEFKAALERVTTAEIVQWGIE
jgi:hypothetical protein